MPNFSSIFSPFRGPNLVGRPLSATTPLATVGSGSLGQGEIIADINGDGRPDYLTAQLIYDNAHSFDNPMNIIGWVSDGASYTMIQSLNQAPASWGLYFPGKLFVSDFNGDGRNDIYVGTFGSEQVIPGQGPGARSVVLLQRGDGSFSRDPTFNPPYTWDHGTTVGDLDGDGRNEILVSGTIGYDSMIFDYQNGAWTYRSVDTNADIQTITPTMRAAGTRFNIFDMKIIETPGATAPNVYVGFDFENRTGFTAQNVPIYAHGLYLRPEENGWSQFVARLCQVNFAEPRRPLPDGQVRQPRSQPPTLYGPQRGIGGASGGGSGGAAD